MDNRFLENYYSSYDEDARLTSPHGSVEFLTTMRYIHRYLKPGMRILEIGAGTGRYSHALARQGYRVDAVELVTHNIAVFHSKTLPGEPVTVVQGNALDLSAFESDVYDMTLLLGPMYHLYTEADQKQALAEAIRVTKPGGIGMAAYCGNDATVMQFCFGKKGLLQEPYASLMDMETFHTTSTPSELFQMYRREDIDRLMEGFAVKRLHYVGTDLYSNYFPDTIDAMEPELFEQYLRYHFYICERPDMVGISHHILDIFQKS